jgi:hypothetical protein
MFFKHERMIIRMIKKWVKGTALACGILLGLSATGCSDTTWAFKVDNITVPTGVYLSYLYINREQVLANASGSSSSSSAASSDALTVSKASSSSAGSASDPWSQKIENQNAQAWAINNATKSSEELAIAEELCKQKNISLTSDEQTSLSSNVSSYMSSYTGFASNGVSSASLQRVLSFNGYLTPKLIQAYYGKGGQTPVSDTDLLNYYTNNFADVKQIYITTLDDSGNALPADQLTKIKSTIDSVYNQVSADRSKFAGLQTQYDQDVNDEKSYPAGFIFPKNSSDFAIFADKAFEMKVGDVAEMQSQYGWHVLYRLPTDTSTASYTDAMKQQVLETMKADDFKKLLDDTLAKAKVTVNQSTRNHYDPKKLKDS